MDGLAMSNGCKKRRGYADFAAGKMAGKDPRRRGN